MKNTKKILAVVLAVGVMTASVAAFAAEIKSPADIVASLTGKTVTQVTQERTAGKTYGTIAKDAGKLDEFKRQMLEQKKAILDQQVKDKKLTQAQADEIYNTIKKNLETCDGTGSAQIGRKSGAGFGFGVGATQGTRGQGFGRVNGKVNGQGRGMGQGRNMGQGQGLMNGSCLTIN